MSSFLPVNGVRLEPTYVFSVEAERRPGGSGAPGLSSVCAEAVWPRVASLERSQRLLAVVSESAGISAVPSKRSSQEDTGTQDDHIAHAGREQARDHDEAKADQRGENRPPRFGSIGMAVDEGD